MSLSRLKEIADEQLVQTCNTIIDDSDQLARWKGCVKSPNDINTVYEQSLYHVTVNSPYHFNYLSDAATVVWCAQSIEAATDHLLDLHKQLSANEKPNSKNVIDVNCHRVVKCLERSLLKSIEEEVITGKLADKVLSQLAKAGRNRRSAVNSKAGTLFATENPLAPGVSLLEEHKAPEFKF